MADVNDETKIEKLVDSETFQIWKFQVTIICKAHDIYDMINGVSKFEKCKTPDEENAWNKKDARAQKIIVTTIEKKLLMHIINCKTASEMFEKLTSLFQKNTDQEKCNLLQQFFSYKYEKEGDISTNISKLENMAHRLNNLKQPIDETMIMSKILAILPERYIHFSTAWESTPLAEKTLSTLTARLLSEESRKKIVECEGAVAFNSSEKKCYTCNNIGHISRFCPKNKTMTNKMNIKCFRCNTYGHYAKSCIKKTSNQNYSCNVCKKNNHKEENCYLRKGKESKISSSEKVVFLVRENLMSDVDDFVVDSGCSSHMTNNVSMIRDMKMQELNIAVAKKGESLESLGVGRVETGNLVLNDVLYAPGLTKNLLSVNAITEKGGEVRFTKNAVIITKDDELVLEGIKQNNGLYTVDLNKQVQKAVLITEKESKAMEWHRKLGHLSLGSMRQLVKLTEGFNIENKELDMLDSTCEVCMESKQTRHPFNTERLRAERPLQIIHTDLCGPIEPKTWDDKSYFLTFLDDYTHYCMVYLLNNKSEVFEYMREYVNQVEAFMNVKVSKIRCDNGGEYVHSGLRTWCKERGVILDYTISYTPQLNGKAERLNRTLMDKARALIFDSKLDKNLWGEAVRTSAFLLNRSPTDSLECTPVEKWTKRKPDLSKLQIFGNNAFSKNLGYLKKLDSRSSKFIFVGYGLNGFRLWDPVKQRIIMSRDVVCTERVETKKSEGRVIMDYTEESESAVHIPEDEQTKVPDECKQHEEIVAKEPQKRTRKLPQYLNDDYVLLTYAAAVTGEESENWKAAIQEEKASLNKNETWEYVDRSIAGNNKILSNRWIFKIKENGRYKARLVVRGCEQEYGIDYQETFSPVANACSIRIIFAIAIQRNYIIKTFDIKTAFLYGEINDEVYMQVPEGYEQEENTICRLRKALYGLKQAPLRWNKRFTSVLKTMGLQPIKTEQCIFKNNTGTILLAIYVDDGIVIGEQEEEIKSLLFHLNKEFQMETNEQPLTYLGIEISRDEENLVLTQENFINSILMKFNMDQSKPVSTPITDQWVDNEVDSAKNKFPYREAIGSLLYLSNKTRPDIAYAVSFASRHMEQPSEQDVSKVKRIFRYLNSTRKEGIRFSANEQSDMLEAFCDSDYAGDITSRKSTTGFVVKYSGGPVAWCSRRQPIVALSSTEAEYIAAADCTKELIYLKSLMEELTLKEVKIKLNIDNQSAIKLIKNGQLNRRSKHIDVRYHFISEIISKGIIELKFCPTEKQTADILTKPLNTVKFKYHKDTLVYKV